MKREIGIYIGANEVIAVAVSLAGSAPNLEGFAIESLKEIVEPLRPVEDKGKWGKKNPKKPLTPQAHAIRRALDKINAKNARVIIAFNPFHLVTRYFEIPAIPRKEWENAVRHEASRYIPFKISETVVDFRISEEVSRETSAKVLAVTSAAVKVDSLRSYVRDLRDGSAKVEAIEPVFLAFSRAVAAGEKLDKDKTIGFLFLDDDGSVNITLSRNGITYLSRDFLLSDEREANQTRFYEELKVSIDFARQKTGTERIENVFIAGAGDLNFWASYLNSAFEKQINFQPAIFPAKQTVSSDVMGKLIIPIGLALRALDQKSPLGTLTLLPPAEKEEKPELLRKMILLELIAITLVFLVIRIIVLEPVNLFMQRHVMAKIGPDAAADPSLPTRSLEELQTINDQWKKDVGQLIQFSKQRSRFTKKLKTLASGMPKPIWLRQISYGPAQNVDYTLADTSKPSARSFILEGHSFIGNPESEVKAINDWVKSLNQDKSFLEEFRTVTVAEVKRDQFLGRGVTTFRLIIE